MLECWDAGIEEKRREDKPTEYTERHGMKEGRGQESGDRGQRRNAGIEEGKEKIGPRNARKDTEGKRMDRL